ncbi:thiol:disulfide interchange protein DsbA [Sinobacterium caligoides]|uniref:Thiol:disulfide interchange protein n=1 Tax=Sinobacterium caligoides TaxID=933926 RepID=A0A3N2DGM9_9GAMM|nr:thiol:disulfide interchange protein DsbA/DsbL [Sinobacterium caligoides]ROR98953.1 thiol:disulfide interchange protein DsbA [Sinobacterium caligoides]
MIKRLIAAVILVSAPVFAFAADYVEGKDYVKLDAPISQSARGKGKIEVFEFFWYGCGHCARFEPTLHAWEKTLADDVVLSPSPAMWNKPMVLHARIFYTAQALNKLGVLHDKAFEALKTNHRGLATEAEVKQFFITNGVAEADFDKAFNGFAINAQIKQADARARGAKIEGTPEMNVNGRYRVSAGMAGGQKQMLEVVDFLVEQERARIATAK